MSKEKKGFFASLKCNPQTAEEAKRKTNNTFIVIAIVCAAIAGLLCFLHYIFGLIAFVFSIPLVGFLYLDGRKKDKRNFCKECGTKYDYQNDISWTITDVVRKKMSSGSSSSTSRRVCQTEEAKVDFTCSCHKCGAEVDFRLKFTVATWYDDGTYKEYNIKDMAKKYFRL